MSAHGLDLKFETHILVLPVISIFILKKVSYIFYLICFCLTHSVMVLTHLAFALVIFISSLLLIICNFTFFFYIYYT